MIAVDIAAGRLVSLLTEQIQSPQPREQTPYRRPGISCRMHFAGAACVVLITAFVVR